MDDKVEEIIKEAKKDSEDKKYDESKFETRVLKREEFDKAKENSLKEETERLLKEISKDTPKINHDLRKTQVVQDTIEININDKKEEKSCCKCA